MSKDGSKRFGKYYMTGCAIGQFVRWKCMKCGAEGEGTYGRPPKTCKKCKSRLYWEEKDSTGKRRWIQM